MVLYGCLWFWVRSKNCEVCLLGQVVRVSLTVYTAHWDPFKQCRKLQGNSQVACLSFLLKPVSGKTDAEGWSPVFVAFSAGRVGLPGPSGRSPQCLGAGEPEHDEWWGGHWGVSSPDSSLPAVSAWLFSPSQHFPGSRCHSGETAICLLLGVNGADVHLSLVQSSVCF